MMTYHFQKDQIFIEAEKSTELIIWMREIKIVKI
jgi:hypothetical protein